MVAHIFKEITPKTEHLNQVSIEEAKQLQSSQRHPTETEVDTDGERMRGYQNLGTK